MHKKQVDQPFIVSHYNHFIGSVDCMDQTSTITEWESDQKSGGALFLRLQLMQVFTTRGSCTGRVAITALFTIWNLPEAECSFICRDMAPFLLFLVIQQ